MSQRTLVQLPVTLKKKKQGRVTSWSANTFPRTSWPYRMGHYGVWNRRYLFIYPFHTLSSESWQRWWWQNQHATLRLRLIRSSLYSCWERTINSYRMLQSCQSGPQNTLRQRLVVVHVNQGSLGLAFGWCATTSSYWLLLHASLVWCSFGGAVLDASS